MATTTMHSRKVLRYRTRPRLVHALLASSFTILLLSGLTLLLPSLAGLAAGGYVRILHYVGAILFISVPIVYLMVDRPAALELLRESCVYDRDDGRWLLRVYRYFMGHNEGMPPQGRLNAGQKIHHAGVVIFSATIVLSGLILFFGKGSLGANGLAGAATIHSLSMLALTVLLVGHLYFTFVYDALAGMTTGYIPEVEARLEHAKWVDSLPETEPWIVEDNQDDQPAAVPGKQISAILNRLTVDNE